MKGASYLEQEIQILFRMKKAIRVVAYIIVGFVLLIVVGLVLVWEDKPAEEEQAIEVVADEPKTVAEGQTGIIRTGVPGSLNKDVLDEVLKAARVSDKEGIQALISSGQAIFIDNNTKVRVIEMGYNKRNPTFVSSARPYIMTMTYKG